MCVPVAVWQPCELLYTCYLLTYLLRRHPSSSGTRIVFLGIEGKKVNVAHIDYRADRVQELIPVLGSQPAGDVNHKPGGRLPLLSARPAFTLATLKRAATNFAA